MSLYALFVFLGQVRLSAPFSSSLLLATDRRRALHASGHRSPVRRLDGRRPRLALGHVDHGHPVRRHLCRRLPRPQGDPGVLHPLAAGDAADEGDGQAACRSRASPPLLAHLSISQCADLQHSGRWLAGRHGARRPSDDDHPVDFAPARLFDDRAHRRRHLGLGRCVTLLEPLA
jgi:hypothetical protein